MPEPEWLTNEGVARKQKACRELFAGDSKSSEEFPTQQATLHPVHQEEIARSSHLPPIATLDSILSSHNMSQEEMQEAGPSGASETTVKPSTSFSPSPQEDLISDVNQILIKDEVLKSPGTRKRRYTSPSSSSSSHSSPSSRDKKRSWSSRAYTRRDTVTPESCHSGEDIHYLSDREGSASQYTKSSCKTSGLSRSPSHEDLESIATLQSTSLVAHDTGERETAESIPEDKLLIQDNARLFVVDQFGSLVDEIADTLCIQRPDTIPEELVQEAQNLLMAPPQKDKVLFIPQTIQNLVLAEWEKPCNANRLPLPSRKLFPLPKLPLTMWSIPEVDPLVMGHISQKDIKDNLDRKIECLLRRAFAADSLAARILANITLGTRAALKWTDELMVDASISNESKTSLTKIRKVLALCADASIDSLQLVGRASVTSTAARRGIWLRSWNAKFDSKLKVISSPFKGKYLFDEDNLKDLLVKKNEVEGPSGSQSTFKPRGKQAGNKQHFQQSQQRPFVRSKGSKNRGSQGYQFPRGRQQRSRGGMRGRGGMHHAQFQGQSMVEEATAHWWSFTDVQPYLE